MTDTPQPEAAGETVVDPMADLMSAIKANDGGPARGADGKFVARDAPQEIEAGEAEEAEPVETGEAEDYGEEEAEEAHPEPVEMPSSWAKEDAEMWSALPAETQEKIRSREAERDTALNQKFQEAANIRKANEALVAEASNNREKFIQAADEVLSLIKLDRPTPQQYGAGTGQYDREGYDLAVAQFEQASQLIENVRQQQSEAIAQHRAEIETAERQAFEAVESQFRPKLLALVPDLSVADKAPQVVAEIARYAVSQGIPEDVFASPERAKRITSPELTLAWKAMQYDKLQEAKGKVEPKAPKAPGPAMRAGSPPSRTAVRTQERQKAFDRLNRDGSIEAGAAVLKQMLFKG